MNDKCCSQILAHSRPHLGVLWSPPVVRGAVSSLCPEKAGLAVRRGTEGGLETDSRRNSEGTGAGQYRKEAGELGAIPRVVLPSL